MSAPALPKLCSGSKQNLDLIYLRQNIVYSLWDLDEQIRHLIKQRRCSSKVGSNQIAGPLCGSIVRIPTSDGHCLRQVKHAGEEAGDQVIYVQLHAGSNDEDSFYVSELSGGSTQPKEVQEFESFWMQQSSAAGHDTAMSCEKLALQYHVILHAKALRGRHQDPQLASLWDAEINRFDAPRYLVKMETEVYEASAIAGDDPALIQAPSSSRAPSSSEAHPQHGQPLPAHQALPSAASTGGSRSQLIRYAEASQSQADSFSSLPGIPVPNLDGAKPNPADTTFENAVFRPAAQADGQVTVGAGQQHKTLGQVTTALCHVCPPKDRMSNSCIACTGLGCNKTFHPTCAGYAGAFDVPQNWRCPSCCKAAHQPMLMPASLPLPHKARDTFIRCQSHIPESHIGKLPSYTSCRLEPVIPIQSARGTTEQYFDVTSCRDKALQDQVVAATDNRLWHGTLDHTAWVAAHGLVFPRVCASPGYPETTFASDSQQDAVLAQGFAEAMRQPQEASFSADLEGDKDHLRVISLQTKTDGHYRYFCPFACSASGGVLHKSSRSQLEQHLLAAHQTDLQQRPTAKVIYTVPIAVSLAPHLGLLFAQLKPLPGSNCRVNLSTRLAKEVQRAPMGQAESTLPKDIEATDASEAAGATIARCSDLPMAGVSFALAASADQPAKCGKCINCKQTGRKKACKLSKCQIAASAGSQLAKLAMLRDDAVGTWLDDGEKDGSLCVVTQYDAYRHEHQVASGSAVSFCPLDSISLWEVPKPATDIFDRLRIPYDANFRREVLAGREQSNWIGGIFISAKGIDRKWWPARFGRDASSATRQMEVQLRVSEPPSRQDKAAHPGLHRTILLEQNHCIFTTPSSNAAAYTIATADVPHAIVTAFLKGPNSRRTAGISPNKSSARSGAPLVPSADSTNGAISTPGDEPPASSLGLPQGAPVSGATAQSPRPMLTLPRSSSNAHVGGKPDAPKRPEAPSSREPQPYSSKRIRM
ncbi:hypothetical protein WJX74_001404 [Apatococcus lobatus]|uniref:PHD-type domain-containing protein n=1 Tax=Apatococcus lobatus TaxID=904363 RepID=A0AAW1Q8X9_9CHLO